MKRVFDQAAERDVYEELTIPAGEFVALLMSALMLLGLFFGSSTLPEGAKTIVADMVATLSHASASLERSMEARAAEHQVRDIKALTLTPIRHQTHMNGHHYRHRGHHAKACFICSASVNLKYQLTNHE
jgi:hypothetical protein